MFVYISTGAGSHNRGCNQLSADSLALKVGGIQKDSEVKKKISGATVQAVTQVFFY